MTSSERLKIVAAYHALRSIEEVRLTDKGQELWNLAESILKRVLSQNGVLLAKNGEILGVRNP